MDSIGRPADWPSVVHHARLPPDADGYDLPSCRAELHRARLALRLDEPLDYAGAATQLWEYAVRWLPGTIVSAASVRTESDAIPSHDTSQGGLGVVAPLGTRDRALAPVVAADLARSLLETIATDFQTERAS